MKELMKNLFWVIVIVLGSMYLLYIEFRNYKYERKLKLKIKYIEEEIVSMKVMNKKFSKGSITKIGGGTLPTKLPDTYIIELEYEKSKYEINDKEIFNSYEVGHLIKLKLVKGLDKNKNIIRYDLFKLK
ncbi:hypothetical protein [Romboutsia sp. 13368]|uniref:hypothetical protein n=1 Tax=Romboutsia sp. 13368 TaxID=2708053 RepID=UPI0025EBDFE1|nr:hypothetical protein [Romboutsia sp. 13368]